MRGNGVHIVSTAQDSTVQGGEFANNGLTGIGANGRGLRVVNAHVHDNSQQGITWGDPGSPVPGNATTVHIFGCDIHDNGKSDPAGTGYGIHCQSTATASVVIAGNVIPRSATQTISLLSIAGTKAAVSNNVLLGYGSGNLGYYPHTPPPPYIRSFNTVDP